MFNRLKINEPFGYFSKLIIIIFAALQLLRLVRLPQFLDIYYHLQVAWGFLQAGGYSSWDFWEYVPLGRPHIYPPLFHILLAGLMKLGLGAMFLAKFFESATPVIFLLILWNFIRKNFNEQLGFFVVLAFSSSFAFSISLANHIPSCLALIFGFSCWGEFLKKRVLQAALLLVLCFYTHLTVPWFFVLSYIFYALMDKAGLKDSFRVVSYSLLAALPILIPEFLKLPSIRLVGYNASGLLHLQIKIVDYCLAAFGLFLAIKMFAKYKLFLSLFLASFIFLAYPYRFLSAEGYIPIILFSALAIQFIWLRLKTSTFKAKKIFMAGLIVFILFISPTLFLDRSVGVKKISYRLDWVDSTFSGMFLAKGDSIWYPWMYLPVVEIIKANSDSQDTVYCDINIAGIILSSLSQRATVNGMLAEVGSFKLQDPYRVSDIIVLSKDLDREAITSIGRKYNLIKIEESKYFLVFRNPVPSYRLKITKAVVSFPVIVTIFFLFMGLFWQKKIVGILRNFLSRNR